MQRPADLTTMFDFGDRADPHQSKMDTPPDLEVSSAIRFVQNDDMQGLSDAEDLVRFTLP